VLFLFASQGLEHLLASAGLPTIPLVPVSSSQAVIGAVVGIGLLRGGREIRWRMLGNISVGWITTPVISAVMCFVALFFLQNVFNQQVYRQVHYELSPPVLEKLAQLDIATEKLDDLQGKEFDSSVKFLEALEQKASLTTEQEQKTLYYAEVEDFVIEPEKIDTLDADWLTPSQITALRELSGRTFRYKWRLAGALLEWLAANIC
jgi:PiT family inorganic phosphate transporter